MVIHERRWPARRCFIVNGCSQQRFARADSGKDLPFGTVYPPWCDLRKHLGFSSAPPHQNYKSSARENPT